MSPDAVANTRSIQCFEVSEARGPSACDVFAWVRVEACFVDEGVELTYIYDLDECDPDEAAMLEPPRGHGDLSWQGRLGPGWARESRAALEDPRRAGEGVEVQVRFTDGEEQRWVSPRTEGWRLLFGELDDIAEEAAGLGAPPPLVVLAHGRERERFELQPRPLEHGAELSWSGARKGRCEVDSEVSRSLRVLARDNTGGEHAPNCPDGPGFFMEHFSSRGGEALGCRIWEPGSVSESSRLDPNLGEVGAAIAALLEALRAAASACSS